MSYSNSFPAVRPTTFDFANSGKLDSRISFSRPDTPPTYAAPSAVHYWSNEKHLSTENLFENSNVYDSVGWYQVRVDQTIGQADPAGGTSAKMLNQASGQTDAGVAYWVGTVGADELTFSIFLKPNGRTKPNLSENLTDSSNALKRTYFDLTGIGAVGTSDAAHTASITKFGDWYRCTIKFTPHAADSGSVYMYASDTDNSQTVADDGNGYIVFGANLSTTGQLVTNETSGQKHRSYSSTLKSVTNAGDPRFEYDPADGQSVGTAKGLLVESQSSNLFARSSGFDYTAAWTKTNVTATAEAISPDGTLNAFAIRENDGGGTKRIHQAATVAAGSVAVSVYAKLLGNERRLVIREDSTTGDSAVFDLSSGTVAATNVGGAGTIESVGNGWYRCTLITSPSGSPGYQFGFWLATATGTNYESYTGDGYSGVLLYGAMCENASASSSLISTSSSTATRSADSCSVALSDIGITSGQDLTAIVEGDAAEIAGAALIGLDDGSSSNYARILRHTNSNYTFDVRTDASSQAVITLGSSSSDTKFAFRLENNNIGAAAGGSAVTTDTSATIGLMTTMQIGNGHWGGAADGTISRVSIYSEPLSDANLTALTS